MSTEQVSFSVIIPTYNRSDKLQICLQALAAQNYPADRFEVIVVDDGSDSDLNAVLRRFGPQPRMALVVQDNLGPAAARNKGAEQATADILAFTDDDCTPDSNWLSALASGFQNGEPAMVGGKIINVLTENPFSAISQLIVDIVYRHYNANPQKSRFFASNNFAIPKEIFSRTGGFNQALRFAEDRELCDRLLFQSFRLVFEEKAVVYHVHNLSFRGFCRQHFGYGRGAYNFHRIRARRGSGSMHNEFKFHMNVRNWLLSPLSSTRGWQAVGMAALIVTWQLVNATGFFWEAFKNRKEVYAGQL